MRVACVGAGFSGAVIARELAEKKHWIIDVYDARSHIAGNCHTDRDQQTGIMVHTYGPHIFHTSDKEVWDYVQRFGKFHPFTNRVKAVTSEGIFSLPINLLTINQLFHKKLSPVEAKAFIQAQSDKSIKNPATFEEQALSMLGE